MLQNIPPQSGPNPNSGIILGPVSQRVTCPICHANVLTTVTKKPNTKTHLFALLLCCVGLFCGCCLIPYFMDSCLTSQHTCPNCGSFIGDYST